MLCDDCKTNEGFEYHHGRSKRVAGHLCSPCWNARVDARKAKRKVDLAAMPRCEANGCKARGRWRIGGHTLLCGKHTDRAKANRVRAAGPNAILLWLEQGWTDRESILRFANE